MASLEFPDRSTQQTSNTTINASDIDIDATQGANINIITSSDHTKEDEEEEKKEDEKEKRRQKILNKLEKINEKISDTLDDIGGQTKEVVDDIVDKVFGNNLIVNKIKEGTYGIIKGVKTGIYKSISNFINFMKLEKKDRILKLRGYVSKLKNIVILPFMMVWKVLKRIDKSITWIAEKLMVGLGKTLKYLIIGVAIFFKWIKKFLTKSILWKALSGVASLIGSGISSILGFGGDLITSIAGKLVSSAAISALTSGIKTLFSRATGKMLVSAIVKALPWAIVAAKLAAIAYGFRIDDAGDKYEDAKMRYINAGILSSEDAFSPDFDMEEWAKNNKDKIKSLDSGQFSYLNASSGLSKAQEYNQFIKEYPTVSRELLKKGWFDSDKDKNGLRDFNEEDYTKIKTLQSNPTNQMLLNDLRLSEAARQELKNKSILKNTAGVSST